MLVGYVSNERYVALADILFEVCGIKEVRVTRSTIAGAVYADLEPGEYEVVLGGSGYGSKGGPRRRSLSVQTAFGRSAGIYVAQMRQGW